MGDLIKQNDIIEYLVAIPEKKGQTFKALIEQVGTIFPYFANGRITTLQDITGSRDKEGVKRGLAAKSRFPSTHRPKQNKQTRSMTS